MRLVSNADPYAELSHDEPSTPGKDPLKVTAGLKGALKSPRVSSAAKERAKRRLDGIAGSAAQLISAQEATVVAKELHTEEMKGPKDPSFDEQARINKRHVQHQKARPEPPQTRLRDRQVGFIDEPHTVDEYKAALQNSKTPRDTKKFARECLTFHREI